MEFKKSGFQFMAETNPEYKADFPIINGAENDTEYLCYLDQDGSTGKLIIYRQPINLPVDWEYVSQQCKKFGINPDNFETNQFTILVWTEKKTG